MSASTPDFKMSGFCLGAVMAFRIAVGPCAAVASAIPHGVELDYVLNRWESVDGLPESSATSIVQTSDGYVWFGTFEGLVRFNGTAFEVFDPVNTPALLSMGVVNLHADRAGRLWISTYDGLVTHEHQQWRAWDHSDGWTGTMVRTFAEADGGDLFLTTFDGKIYEFAAGRFIELPSPPGEVGQGYLGGVDEMGRLWVAQNRFVGSWEAGRWVSQIAVPPHLAPDAVGIASARDGGLWLLLDRELLRIRDGQEVSRITLLEAPGGVWSVSEDSRGHVWIASYNEGFSEITTDGVMRRWGEAMGVSDAGRCVFEDGERNLWLGTSGDGLIRLSPRRFRHFPLGPARKGLLVRSVFAAREGGVWAATYGHGLLHVSETGAVSGPPLHPALDAAYLQSVIIDRSGRFWIGTLGDGLRVLEEHQGRSIPQEQTGGHNPIALFEDSRGHVWVSGGVSAARFDGLESHPFGAEQGLPAGGITCFAETPSGQIWLSNGQGVFRSEDGSRFVQVLGPSGESIPRILCLWPDPDGSVWLGSSDRGLLRWRGGLLAILGEPGFPARAIQSIVEDKDGHLWMTSDYRIVRARRADLHAAADGGSETLFYQVFDSSDGVPVAEFSGGRQPAAVRDDEGKLWFATTKGVVMIDPAGLRLNDRPPPVVIERFSFSTLSPEAETTAFGRGIQRTETRLSDLFAEPLVLPAGSRHIEIEYAGLSYSSSEKIRYQVRLENWDSGWIDAGNRRVALYHGLPPGKYQFHVRAANNDGLWNEAGVALAFALSPHYWQTDWFRLGLVLLIAALSGSSVWWQSRSHVRRALERERAAIQIRELAGRLINAQEEERRRIARELHDDFSQRLALLSVEIELLGSGGGPNSDLASRLTGLATRTKELATEVHRMAYKLHPAKLDQLGLVAASRAYCREVSEQTTVRVEFNAHTCPPVIHTDHALCLYRILQESLQNVVRHSGASQALVSLRQERDHLTLSVQDSGLGFVVEGTCAHAGLGLSSMRERVRLVGGTLTVESQPGQGTQIRVCLPLAVASAEN